MLVNLPPSHVGCQGEELMTTFFTGSTAVILSRFDAEKSLQAIERYKVESMGQIPSMFQMQWQLPNFAEYDLSSLRSGDVWRAASYAAIRASACVRLLPVVATGLGMTEMAGFVTYTGLTNDVDYLVNGVGCADADHAAIDPPADEAGRHGRRRTAHRRNGRDLLCRPAGVHRLCRQSGGLSANRFERWFLLHGRSGLP